MSNATSGEAKSGFPVEIEKALLVAVPTIVVLGGAFWFGYLNVAGRAYLWLLTVQDLLLVSLLLVPLYGITLGGMYALGGFREPMVQTDRGPTPMFVGFARLGGDEWSPRSEKWIRNSGVVVTLITVLGIGVLVLYPRSWVTTWIFTLIAIPATYAQLYTAYHRVRFGGANLLQIGIWSLLFVVLTTAIGSSNALSAEQVSARSYRIEFDDGRHVSVTGLQKLGEHFLFYDQATKAWWVRRVDDVVSLSEESKLNVAPVAAPDATPPVEATPPKEATAPSEASPSTATPDEEASAPSAAGSSTATPP